jgi:hypothetical protein
MGVKAKEDILVDFLKKNYEHVCFYVETRQVLAADMWLGRWREKEIKEESIRGIV